MGDGHDRKVSTAEAKDAMKPVATPLPKPQTLGPGAKVDTDHAPTVQSILEPNRPALDGLDTAGLLESLSHLVTAIFEQVLIPELLALKPQLAEVTMPPADDLAAKLLGYAVSAVATATLTELGGLAAAKLGTVFERGDKSLNAAAGVMAKDGGKAVGGATQDRMSQKPASGGEPEVRLSQPGAPLADQFVDMQRLKLIEHEADATEMLRIIRASAARQRPAELAALDSSLKQLVGDGSLSCWFRYKVTMEWLNFIARLSLGRRPEGQVTNMPGANAIGGIAEAGTTGIVQWHKSHEGFIEITVDAESSAALTVIDTVVSGRPGAAGVLKSIKQENDAAGNPYSLATIPVFRRIWLKTGDARFDTTPAFVITPEGALEINLDDPKLATLGGAHVPELAGPYEGLERARRDPNVASERANRATFASAGAARVMTVLQSKNTEGLR
jgi:hypothetical protein